MTLWDLRGLSALPAGWARRGVASEIFDAAGMTATYVSGQGHVFDLGGLFPAGTVETKMLSGPVASSMIGAQLFDAVTSHAGAASHWYNAPSGALLTDMGAGHSYSGSAFLNGGGSPAYPVWFRVRFAAGSVYGSYSTDGVTWSTEVHFVWGLAGISEIGIGCNFGGDTAKFEYVSFTPSGGSTVSLASDASGTSDALANGNPVIANAHYGDGVSNAQASGTPMVTDTASGSGLSRISSIGSPMVTMSSGLVASGISGADLSRRVPITVLLAEETDAPRAPGVYIPSGDRYGDAHIISGSNGMLALSFTGAGTETGEPLPAGVMKTLWLLWETDEQTNPRVVFDTGVASIVIGDDDPAIAGFSSVWDGEGGVAAYPNALSFYKVQLGWRTGDPPDFTLTWESDDPPFYDEFSTPYEMAGDEDRANLSTEFCTLQPSEPVAVGTQTSAWSRWEPSSSGEAILETSDPALIIRVYEDSVDITSLTLVTSGTGSVTFTATDPAYLIQICDTTEPGA